jgi:hypothetical protein
MTSLLCTDLLLSFGIALMVALAEGHTVEKAGQG